MDQLSSRSLEEVAPELARVLARNLIHTPPRFAVGDIGFQTVQVTMRDGVKLATDVYKPPVLPAPVIAVRTPYGRGADAYAGAFLSFVRRGYVVVSQDCRGTGDSEPGSWDYYMFEPDDGYDLAEWICSQPWYGGFIGAFGSSYVGQTQWCMAVHPRMSAIAPEVSGLGIAVSTVHLYMFQNAYARCVGKGEGKVSVHYTEMERLMTEETMAGGFFNESLNEPFSAALISKYPQIESMGPTQAKRWLWEKYCSSSCAGRAEFIKSALGTKAVSTLEVERMPAIFGYQISHDAHTLPTVDRPALARSFQAPALLITGWYDWGIGDTLSTWELLRREASEPVRANSRLLITPSAHNVPGYHEGMAERAELQHNHRTVNNVELLLRWFATVQNGATDSWPRVIYYLMGANEWRAAADWPPPDAREQILYLGDDGALLPNPPRATDAADRYTYDPLDPTPTKGGSIVSYVYPPGSVDVSDVQRRTDVLTYTTQPLDADVDVVGPLRLILFVSSSAIDTDFSGRISDVFPDGRAVQIQSGILRTRYRNASGEPEFMEVGRIYRLDIELWSTANRFRAGHSLRLDISSADFPRFDRNMNLGGAEGQPVKATQTIYRDVYRPSHLLLSVTSERGF